MALAAKPDDPRHDWLLDCVKYAGGRISIVELRNRFRREFGCSPVFTYKKKEIWRLGLEHKTFRIKANIVSLLT